MSCQFIRGLGMLAAVLLVPPTPLLRIGGVIGHTPSVDAARSANFVNCGSRTIFANRPHGTWHTNNAGYPHYRFTAAPLRPRMISRQRAILCGLRMTSSPMRIPPSWRVRAKFGRYTDRNFLPLWSWVVTFTGAKVVPGGPKGGPDSHVMAVVDGMTGTVFTTEFAPN
jgi:hypothetical protein